MEKFHPWRKNQRTPRTNRHAAEKRARWRLGTNDRYRSRPLDWRGKWKTLNFISGKWNFVFWLELASLLNFIPSSLRSWISIPSSSDWLGHQSIYGMKFWGCTYEGNVWKGKETTSSCSISPLHISSKFNSTNKTGTCYAGMWLTPWLKPRSPLLVAFTGSTVQTVFSSSLALVRTVAFIGSTVRTSPLYSASVTRDWIFSFWEILVYIVILRLISKLARIRAGHTCYLVAVFFLFKLLVRGGGGGGFDSPASLAGRPLWGCPFSMAFLPFLYS